MNVLADRAAMVETQTGIDREPVTKSYAIGNEESSGFELATDDRGIARDRLKRLAGVVDVPGTRRDNLRLPVLALFDFSSHSQRVIRCKQPSLVVVQDRLCGR